MGIKVLVYTQNILDSFNISQYMDNLRSLITILERGYDLVFSNTLLAFWGIDIGQILRIPSVLGIHESVDYRSYYSNFPKHIAERALENIQRATKVVFVSEATARMFNDLDTGNFAVIPNAVDIERIEAYKRNNARDAIRRELGIKDKETVITITGTTCQRKGQIVFAKAARLLLNHTKRDDLIFYIVGGRPSPYFSQLEDYIRCNGLNEKIRIIMETPDILKYYYSSDIFVCASFEESSPLVILEAMSFDLPIIATNVFGIPELIRNNVDGILIEAGNEERLAEKMEFYLNDKRTANQFAQNAYYRLLRKYSLARFASDYDDCFRSVYSEGENRVFKELANNKGMQANLGSSKTGDSAKGFQK
jgi:glycosyltransferase involved in cell wall biosynthesis